MKETKNVPQLRFSGFDDDWEEMSFSEITYISATKNKSNLPLESYSITNENGFIPQDEQFENGGTMKDADKKMYWIVPPKSFGYNPARINVGSIGYYDGKKDVIVSSLYEIFKMTENCDDAFFWQWFKSDNLQKQVLKLQEGGVRLYFYYDKLCMGEIKIPSKGEQQKIGSLLSNLDSLIQAKTKKLESFKAVKKSLLQKCFLKAGEKVPEMRFESNKEWASINFEDCFSFLSNNSFSRDELNYEKGYIKSLHYGDVLIKFGEILNVSTASLPYITQINSPKQYSKSILKNGDIVIADAAEDNTVGKCTEIQNCTELLAAGLHTIAVRPKIEFAPTFLGFCINSESFHNQLLPLIQGTKVSSISKSAIVDTVIYYPISITEQQKIGQFFSKYDSLISAQQKEIDKLKDIKKSLLQKMFV